MKITALTCVKNEGPFLLEWIAYGRLIGVTDFIVYSNDCDDGTDRLLDALDAAQIVEHVRNPAREKFQLFALNHVRKNETFHSADYVWNADVDEFLNIKVGNGTIPELVKKCGSPSAISVSNQFFANNGVHEFVDEPIITQFDRSHNPDIFCDSFELEVKTLINPQLEVGRFGIHRPFLLAESKKNQSLKWTDGSGRPVDERFKWNKGEGRRFGFVGHGSHKFASLNHYALRSLDSYLVKTDRGDANRVHRHFEDDYWRNRNDSSHHDQTIQRHSVALVAEIAALKSMGTVGSCHTDCVNAHRAKVAKLRADPWFEELRARILKLPSIPPVELAILEQLKTGLPKI